MSIKFKHCCAIEHNDYLEAQFTIIDEIPNEVIRVVAYDSVMSAEINLYLDKKTAIRFAKTLRTEINKIETGGYNG
jgi:hypothetical protein